MKDILYIVSLLSGGLSPPQPTSGSPSDRRPTFGAEKDAQKNPTWAERGAEESYLEYCREIGRSMARSALNPAPQFVSNGGVNYASPQYTTDGLDAGGFLFGISGYICNKCYHFKIRMSYFVPGGHGGSVDPPVFCNGDGEEVLKIAGMTAEEYIAMYSKKLSEYVKSSIMKWTKNKPVLRALEMTDQLKANERRRIIVSNVATGLEKSITLSYSEEKCVVFSHEDTPSWAQRAILNGRTMMDDKEVLEFLNKTGNSSFGFFKQKRKDEGPSDMYMLAITSGPAPDRTEKPNSGVFPPSIQNSTPDKKQALPDVQKKVELQQQPIVIKQSIKA